MGDLSTTGKGSVSDVHMSQLFRACHFFHRATEGDFASTFDGPVWAYMCYVSGGIFLKEAVGMTAWRAEARRSPPGTPRHRRGHLPVSMYWRGNCDACSSRVRRAAKRAADRPADAVPPPASFFPPTQRAHRPQPPMTPPPSTPPQFPPDAVFPRVSSGRVRGCGAPRMPRVRGLPDMARGRTVPVRAA